jgi:crotonobetainyl-CoA:carnitine CoA-transferase CaiB-like acyl-CoA transferase
MEESGMGMGVLAGLTVVDVTGHAAGPFCTMLLGDLGADVIKVEPPQGEHSRDWGGWGRDGKSFLFYALNRNKRSVVIDLKTDAGQRRIRELAATADVLVESLAPGGADKLGLGYESLAADNPRLIYCSISGFGRSGPLRDELGLDQMLQAFTGIMAMTGEPDRPPVRMAVSAIDMLTGALALNAIQAALLERERSGRGQSVEASLYDSALSMLCWSLPQVSITGVLPSRMGSGFSHVAPYGVFAAKDDYVYIGVATPAHWRRFCTALGREDLLTDPRFDTPAHRVENRVVLHGVIEDLFAEYDVATLVSLLKPAGVPSSPLRTVAAVLTDDHAWERGSLRRLESEPDVVVAAHPFGLERGFRDRWLEPPLLGASTEAVLGERHPGDADSGHPV